MATLTVHRRTLAPYLGFHERFTASATANNTTAQIECLTGSQNGMRFKSSIASASLLENKWLHRPAAASDTDYDRRIATYTPSSGLAVPEDNWTNAPTSEAFEVHGLASGAEMHEWLNEGLKMCWVTREFTFTVSHANIRQHNLAATATWLKDWRWIRQIGHLQSGESRIGTSTVQQTDPFSRPKGGKGYNLPGQVWIEGPELSWQTTDTVYCLAVVPAYHLCRATSGGTYGDRDGLAAEAHESPVDAEWLAWAAIIAAGKRLEHLIKEGGSGAEEARKSQALAASRFSRLTRSYFKMPELTFRNYVSIAPSLGYVR